MKIKAGCIFIAIYVLASVGCCCLYAQQTIKSHTLSLTLSEIAVMDLEPAVSSIALDLSSPSNAGASIQTATNNDSWINYSSCLAPSSPSRNISVQLTGTLPLGVELQLGISSASGIGNGVWGTSVGAVTLSGVTTTIISGIGGCYTGNGSNNGHQLSYSVVINNYAALEGAIYGPFLVTYTISN